MWKHNDMNKFEDIVFLITLLKLQLIFEVPKFLFSVHQVTANIFYIWGHQIR